jgi:biotin synthase
MSEPDPAVAFRAVIEAGALTRGEIIRLLGLSEAEARETLFPAADAVRKTGVGDAVFLRGIIEFSNICTQDCLYCGLRRSNTDLKRYRMTDAEILAAARRIKKEGIGTVVLQSGEDGFFTTLRLCSLVEKIKADTGLAITLSVGERSREEYRAFRKAGAERYLLKYETTSEDLYRSLRPGRRLGDRLRSLTDLRELGYEVGTGNMVGLPGQTAEILADDLLLMKTLDADMLGIGPFLPHPQTPLASSPPGALFLTLKAVAVARLLTKTANIPATTALSTLNADGRLRALEGGANVVMPDFTPPAYRLHYEIYPGRERAMDLSTFLRQLYIDIEKVGRKVGKGSGGRQKIEPGQGISLTSILIWTM